MEELQKVVKVSKPDLTIFLGEAITGNDCIEQAQEFQKMVHFDGIILSKADVDQKGGAAISISYITKKPIMYIGVGQNYEDLREFTTDFILENLGL
jgi:fused signal recognition particle receptor